MSTVWRGRFNEAAAKYGEHAPTVAVCCNVCRTCVSTNVIAVAWAAGAGAVLAAARLLVGARRRVAP